MKENLKNSKGITLIALVITIIVMLILVTVTIRVATSGNLFTHASNAVKGTKTAIADEDNILNDNLDKSIEEIVAEATGGTAASGSVSNPYPENTWAKAWTYSSTNNWSGETTDNTEELTGDVAAKAYTVDGGYHLVIEKIGSSGEMGNLLYASANESTKIAEHTPYANDSLKFIIAKGGLPKDTWHGWKENISGQIVKVSICDGIINIPESAFTGCENLVDVDISNTVESIGSFAFSNCTSLQEITIPASVANLGEAAFASCTALTTVRILSNEIEEMNRTFEGCTNLTTISAFPSGLREMKSTFWDCTNLSSIPTLPNTLVNMQQAFINCTSLTTVPNIPTSVTNLNSAFFGCTGLTVVPNLWTRVTENTTTYEGTPDGKTCFKGCTGASNYSQIPDYWKTDSFGENV